jgi:preprotein translocase subunit SecG
MVQAGKGGGLASGFVSSGQVMGVQKTTDFIEKLTWGLAITLVVLCLFASLALPSREQRNVGSALQEQAESAPAQQAPPVMPPQQNPQTPPPGE